MPGKVVSLWVISKSGQETLGRTNRPESPREYRRSKSVSQSTLDHFRVPLHPCSFSPGVVPLIGWNRHRYSNQSTHSGIVGSTTSR